jgi:hypothetical protein
MKKQSQQSLKANSAQTHFQKRATLIVISEISACAAYVEVFNNHRKTYHASASTGRTHVAANFVL